MRCEIKTEYELPMCLDNFCTPMEITLPPDFILRDIEVNSSASPLSHLCSISVIFGSEIVYDGPIGKQGFIMQITEMEPRADYPLKFMASCAALHNLVGEPIEPIKVVIRGYEMMDEETPFEESFTSAWE
jgi:hypothetical protein